MAELNHISTSGVPAGGDGDLRLAAIQHWITQLGFYAKFKLTPASSDASFRRYLRVQYDQADNKRSAIVMDAPPERENCRPFLHVAQLMHEAGLHVPEVLAQDLEQGFLLLSDLGTQTYLQLINDDNADALFSDAIATLLRWQLASRPDVLPAYNDALLRQELALFPDWYMDKHLRLDQTAAQQAVLGEINQLLVRRALAQPAVYVHRDYMPRNLMISTPNPGVLDFQDAVYGPISYDVVSLFKDAFLSWPEERVRDWSKQYWHAARAAGLPVAGDFKEFHTDFVWMGIQRHLKVLGIFARINYRDGKPVYLADTPRFFRYVREAAAQQTALAPLARLFDALETHAARANISV